MIYIYIYIDLLLGTQWLCDFLRSNFGRCFWFEMQHVRSSPSSIDLLVWSLNQCISVQKYRAAAHCKSMQPRSQSKEAVQAAMDASWQIFTRRRNKLFQHDMQSSLSATMPTRGFKGFYEWHFEVTSQWHWHLGGTYDRPC